MDELDSKKAEWRSTYGQIAETTSGKQELVFRPPNLAEWEEIENKLASASKDKAAHIRQFSRQMLLYPSRDEYDTWLETNGAFPVKLLDVLGSMVGGAADITVKKG